MRKRKWGRYWMVFISDLSEPWDRMVSRHMTEEDARAEARRLNAQAVAASGCQTPGPEEPLYYACIQPHGSAYRKIRLHPLEV